MVLSKKDWSLEFASLLNVLAFSRFPYSRLSASSYRKEKKSEFGQKKRVARYCKGEFLKHARYESLKVFLLVFTTFFSLSFYLHSFVLSLSAVFSLSFSLFSLSPWCQFHQHIMSKFFIRMSFQQLFLLTCN